MATQEPNVYAGLSVVIGGLMHARPKFFAKVMGELLFWVGEDKMTFGSDYGIWEPKWQVEGFVDWQMPDGDEFSDYPRLTTATKKKILGLNAAKLYDIKVPAEFQLPADGRHAGRAEDDAELVDGVADGDRAGTAATGRARTGAALRAGRPGHRARPGARRAHHHPGVRASCTVSDERRCARSGCACRPTSARPTSPSSWWPTPTTRSPRVPGVRCAEVILDDHFASDAINAGVAARAGLRRLVRRRGRRRAGRPARDLPAQGGAGRHRPGLPPAGRRRHGPSRAGRPDPGRAAGVARARPAAAPPRRARAAGRTTTRRCSSTRPPGRRRRRRPAAAPAPGPAHPHRHRGQHRHLLRHAARTATPRTTADCRRARTAR